MASATVTVVKRNSGPQGRSQSAKTRSDRHGTFVVPVVGRAFGEVSAGLPGLPGTPVAWQSGDHVRLVLDTSRYIPIRIVDSQGHPLERFAFQHYQIGSLDEHGERGSASLLIALRPGGVQWLGRASIQRGERWFLYDTGIAERTYVFLEDVRAGRGPFVIRLDEMRAGVDVEVAVAASAFAVHGSPIVCEWIEDPVAAGTPLAYRKTFTEGMSTVCARSIVEATYAVRWSGPRGEIKRQTLRVVPGTAASLALK
jgi:hypothetical protein